jgi:hypothetical protein
MIVLIEMPWAAIPVATAKPYLKDCIRDCILREEIPISLQSMIVLSEALIPSDIDHQFEIKRVHKRMAEEAGLVAFYVDHGWSKSMIKTIEWAKFAKVKTVQRKIYTGD